MSDSLPPGTQPSSANAGPDPANPQVWSLRHVELAESTNDLARDLPAWSSVVAESQQAGRGRHGRKFVSAPGGLWLSAVVPIPGGPARWTGLALAVGWALRSWLLSLPCPGSRLRWPNDLMIGHRKLGGILLEQSHGDRCVVGIGINVLNDPAAGNPELHGITTRLADHLADCPTPRLLVDPVLDRVAAAQRAMALHGLAGLVSELNACWSGAQLVEVLPVDGPPVQGRFLGIDAGGALVLALCEGGGRVFPAHLVERMLEIY